MWGPLVRRRGRISSRREWRSETHGLPIRDRDVPDRHPLLRGSVLRRVSGVQCPSSLALHGGVVFRRLLLVVVASVQDRTPDEECHRSRNEEGDNASDCE